MPPDVSDAELGERLAARTLELIDEPSESRDEARLASRVAAWLGARDLGDTCVLAGRPDAPVLLAGHLDTVPAQGNRPGRRDGERVHGLGASDMKGALAVMVELALAGAPFGLLFFGREELPVSESALSPLLARERLAPELVVMMEPTANELHLGCLGNVNATWTFRGRSGHSARPWLADNAIERAAAGVLALSAHPPAPHAFEGLEFREVASVTRIAGGIADNVIPDRVECALNFRYAPGRGPGEAQERLAELCGGHGELRIDSNAPSGAVPSGNRHVDALAAAGGLARAPKQAWTPVAEFARAGLDAVNFGPGDPVQAHTRAESVEVRALVRSYRVLVALAPVKLSPVLEGMPNYPFVRLTEAKRQLAARGVAFVDFGMGEPREETPAFIREALAAALEPLSTYPLAEGLAELRAAIAEWIARRFGAHVDADAQVVPTLGSKEAIFHMAQVVGGDLVAVTTPAYPVPERGARFAGRAVLELPLDAQQGFLPDLDAVGAATWERVGLLWLSYPNNPTAATAPLGLYERAAELARRHDFLLASDEAYSEIYFGAEPPASALQLSDLTNVAVLNTLSKRSSMPGYRSGFVAGDPQLVAALRRYRPNVGVAPQEFVQRAAAAAWRDEAHVEAVRAGYRAKRDTLLPALEAASLRHAGGDATFFLWLEAGEDAEAAAARLLERGIVVAPGSFFGAGGQRFLRLALVPTLAECRRAAELLAPG